MTASGTVSTELLGCHEVMICAVRRGGGGEGVAAASGGSWVSS
ncbi:MAG: hypothetical protein ACKESB_00945 [Candidatus Hodgkinia cicadicola]